MNFIDLFSGAGGLSEGFIKAGFTPSTLILFVFIVLMFFENGYPENNLGTQIGT